MRVTHGCIRMFPEDIAYLFERVGVDTPVMIINEPLKMGWDGDELLLEVHRTLESAPPPVETTIAEVAEALADAEDDSPEALVAAVNEVQAEARVEQTAEPLTGEQEHPPRGGLTALTESFVAATQLRQGEIDWEAAATQVMSPSGIPSRVGRSIKNAATSAASE